MRRVENILHDVIDDRTGELVTYTKVLIHEGGGAMSDAKCDGVLYRKYNGEYFKRTLINNEINALWYGPVGDGVTEDTIPLQKAINASAGKTLVIPPAPVAYYCNRLNIPSNVNIKGHGAKIKMVNTNGYVNDYCIYINLVENVNITGLEVDLEDVPGDQYIGTIGIAIRAAKNISVTNCYVRSNNYLGITVRDNCDNIYIENNTVKDTDTCIHCMNPGTRLHIINNKLSGGHSEGITVYGKSVEACPSDIVISNNIISDKVYFGISLPYVKNATVSGNIISGCDGGITLYDPVSTLTNELVSSDVVIAENQIFDCDKGIYKLGSRVKITSNRFHNIVRDAIANLRFSEVGINYIAENVTICDNQITNVGFAGLYYGGIHLKNVTKAIVSNNSIEVGSGGVFGIQLADGADKIKITDNYCLNSKIGSDVPWAYANSIVIKNNICTRVDLAITGSHLPLSSEFKAIVEDNTQTDTFNISSPYLGVFDIAVFSGIREDYTISTASTISDIPKSWKGRVISLLSDGGFQINHGNLIKLPNNQNLTIAAGSTIRLKFDGTYWRKFDNNESISNKTTSTALGNSDDLYPSQKAVKGYVDSSLLITSRRVSILHAGEAGQANYWSKVASINLGSTDNQDFSLTLLFSLNSTDRPSSAIVTFFGRQDTSGGTIVIKATTIAYTGESNGYLSSNGFKIVNSGYGSEFAIYITKKASFGLVSVYELAKSSPVTATYYSGQAWSAVIPTGTYEAVAETSFVPQLTPSTTGTSLTFSEGRVYGSKALPETGSITVNITNAKLGVSNLVIHNSGTVPTFDSIFKKDSTSGSYVTGQINYIECRYIAPDEIVYRIYQRV